VKVRNDKTLYIYGAGKNGKFILENMQFIDGTIFVGFIDKNENKTEYCGYPVFNLENVKVDDSIVIISLGNSRDVIEVYYYLSKLKFSEIFVYYKEQEDIKMVSIEDVRTKLIDTKDWGDEILSQAEIHVVDFCNLNCKGCTHFSPLFPQKYPLFDNRIRDVLLLRDKFTHVFRFYLLGGEPFLNPDIDKYIIKIRELLPNTIISIVTNGILIPQVSESVWDVIRNNNIYISISEYKPTHNMIGTIKNVLNKEGIKYTIRSFDGKQVFNKPLSLNKDSKFEKCCISSGCINIYDGKISKCPTLMYIDKFNEYFGTKLPNEGIFDMNDCTRGRELAYMLSKSVPLCDYCVNNPIGWEVCGKECVLEDFATYD